MDLEAEQRAFENWYEADAMPLEHSNWFRCDNDGDYELDYVHWAWRGWLARAERVSIEQKLNRQP